MRKNTSCGHHGCPPAPPMDKAKSKSLFSEDLITIAGGTEVTTRVADVLLSNLTEAEIHLPTYATHIKRIKKNVFLTQCEARPSFQGSALNLFIEGYIHKNIQYVEDGFGNVKDYSVKVPFKIYERVDGVFVGLDDSVKDDIFQFRELAKDGHGGNRCEFGSLTFEVNNEPLRCKLLASIINQWDVLHNFDKWGRFNKITEKDEIILAVRITQQQGPFPNSGAAESDDVMASIYDKMKEMMNRNRN